ncbi:MAG: hypothetical protein Q9174_007101 [Haloplaca sp. 1 TL-2023]
MEWGFTKKKPNVPHEYRHRVQEGYIHSPVGSSRDSSDSEGYVRVTEDTTYLRWSGDQTKYVKPTPAQEVKQSLKHSWDSLKTEPLTAENLKRHSLPLAEDVAAYLKEKANAKIAEATTSLQKSSFFAKWRSTLVGDETHEAPEGQQETEKGGPAWSHDFYHTYDPLGVSDAYRPQAKNQAQTDRHEAMKKYWGAKSGRSSSSPIAPATGLDTEHGVVKHSPEPADEDLEASKSTLGAHKAR